MREWCTWERKQVLKQQLFNEFYYRILNNSRTFITPGYKTIVVRNATKALRECRTEYALREMEYEGIQSTIEYF